MTAMAIVGFGLGLAAIAALVVLVLRIRSTNRALARMSRAVERLGQGEPFEPVAEEGPEPVARLGRTINRARAEITDRIETMGEERSEREAILSSLVEGILLFDQEGFVVYQNPRAGVLLGVAINHARDLSPSSLRAIVGAEHGRPGWVEFETGPARRTIQAGAIPTQRESRVLVVLRDVTEARLVDSIRRDFAANASHELKTPSASIQALAETIADAALHDPAAVPGFAERLEAEAVRLSRVVSDLLDLSRLESGVGTPEEVRLDRVVAEEADRYRDRAEEAGLAFRVSAGGPTVVLGSARDLGLLARNLIENAIQYTRGGGSIDVAVGVEDGQALLSVSDTGIGIPSRDQGRIFERFYRVDRARSRETGGTGLGLSIVKHVAENHGGTVVLHSELGKGSTFTVRLPLANRSRS
jgi:signal transduction histidine kinase